ncbi:MAG: glycosyltransferase family 4 protein [Oleispira sp.]|nr:glycosyltransferase family 4 protein [Oleispira sp.]
MSKRVLVIGYVWPEPNSSAAGSRMMQLIDAMRAQDWEVTFASPAQLSEHMADLDQWNVACETIELNNKSFDDYIKGLNPDIVLFDRFMMEEQFGWRVEKFCPQALRILNTEDLHSLREARQQQIKQGKLLNLETEIHLLHTPMAIREIAAIHRSDLTLMISQVEIELLIEHFNVPPLQLLHLPFMLEVINESAQDQLPSFEHRQHFISIGNFRHAPNWDAVLQLKQHIWRLIRKQLPKAELHIYGAYPPPKATQLHNAKQGFHIKGWAKDAKAVMQQARVCLAPLRFGAGIKGKLTDAMQCGTPSLTTTIGSEGMFLDQWNGEIIDTQEMMSKPQIFADSAVKLYQDETRFTEYQKAGYSILSRQYDKNHWQPLLIERLLLQKQQQESLRRSHFIGLMLRHHSMKSTQYMAQWIEAKNKAP